jgi:TRAP-type C4-dicarboxylate transport system permease small subunit
MRTTIDRLLGGFLAVLMSVITIDVLWGVITRYLVGQQASWTEELARFLLIWIGMLGAAYAAGRSAHLAIDLLPSKLEGKAKRRLDRFIRIVVLLFAASVMVLGGVRYVYITFKLGQISPAMLIPMGYVYLAIPFSGLLVIYYMWHDMRHPESPVSKQAD